ncbi:WD repeat-containing protein, putative [Talaromyces stipitatus ATCC 10500]|uniref:Mitochondrial division protein 1 n=1 Tax=Talaromyces stipitatus (strain ATCC 10500 / CBS 375.48 / QM 6759 / NRRL 1006) TaxID=441959 RepID=B8MUY2_TALSN|nr:WD repeat-containing protein, putative [Talaromyces stipitatus ATCC 10500]EED11823.1 WD repeat-containing protein, putative [Talaromyces stipitatus ATCC 10500]
MRATYGPYFNFCPSRPELAVCLGFNQDNSYQDLVLHELPKPKIEHDIRVYLEDKLSKIRDERLFSNDWPGNEAIKELVQMAVPLFIFAATTCRFIKEGTHPKKHLQDFLKFQVTTSASQIGKVYLPILNQLMGDKEDDPEELLKEFRDIVGVIILLATPLSVKSLARLLNLPEQTINELLDLLHSVLNIPSDKDVPIRILHLSFQDYLLTTESLFHIDERKTYQKIALHYLHVINTSLKHNICGLPSYRTQRDDIDRQAVNQNLSADLQYACQYWAYHLNHSEARIVESLAFDFLKKHFLHWLEALSLMGVISEAVAMIDAVQSGDGKGIDVEISGFLYDAKQFILKNTYIAGIAPLQLYSSGLVFSPMQSIVRRIFSGSIPKHLHILPQVENLWSPGLQTLEGHSDSVRSVAFSLDGQTLASGSDDKTVKLWNIKTGSELQTLRGHSSSVHSVGFSPDGQTLASGSSDDTIKLWNVKTGSELQTLRGHSYSIWNVKTGSELQTLRGHSSSVHSVAFSLHTVENPATRSATIPQLHHNCGLTSYSINPQISLSNNWVALGGENLLWLPPEHRQFETSAVKDATLALGYSDGRVSIIGFHTL